MGAVLLSRADPIYNLIPGSHLITELEEIPQDRIQPTPPVKHWVIKLSGFIDHRGSVRITNSATAAPKQLQTLRTDEHSCVPMLLPKIRWQPGVLGL